MKKITFSLLATIFFTSIFHTQTVSIPGTNFETALVNSGIDTNSINGNILISDAQGITTLNISNENITDITGISAFEDLVSLNCINNAITTLNLSQNLSLETLVCGNNHLTSLNISQNNVLRLLNCNNNSLSNANQGFRTKKQA
tara:strand:- start:670 stop:1101 length:432 start_codon:yes stop_codon:yes gene_type:complete